jgi:1,4-alpha-glucan branching enzyme
MTAFETAYEYLGVHREDTEYIFRVWAREADSVYVVGDFNSWNESCPMTLVGDGIWERRVSAQTVCEGDLYKYKIKKGLQELYKADPYAFCTKDANETASVICDISGYAWRDKSWLEYRRNKANNEPINIYKIHAPSWKCHENGTLYSWTELATELAPYVKQMGYTHVELTPIMEHQCENTFECRIYSYYAPISRMGKPCDLMSFIDSMHEAGIGVILDWIPSCFAENKHSLADFDGQPLYKYEDENKTENILNGTRYFDLGRNEVKSFLVSNAHFWILVYHADGLRLDSNSIGICSESDEGMSFCSELNSSIKKHFPDVLIIDTNEKTFFDDFNECYDKRSDIIKLSLGYKITFPCKKSLFMGTEIGQLFKAEQEISINWDLLDCEQNARLQYYVAELNHFYLKASPLWCDEGFESIDTNDSNVMSYRRIDDNDKELIIILNFASAIKENFSIGVSKKGAYEEIFNSDDIRFGGKGMINSEVIESENIKCQKYSESIKLDIPPMSFIVLRYIEQSF